MAFQEIESKIIREIERHRQEILSIGRKILQNPELGYREESTSRTVREEFDKMGIRYTYPHALTGVKGKLSGKSDKFNVCIIGELDAVKCAEHPYEGKGQAAHACGHNAQIAAMIGAAYGLNNTEVLKELNGSITFLAVPAEEFIELDYRRNLRKENKIKYMGGKQQLIYEGVFDDVDMAIMIHAQPDETEPRIYVRGFNLGFLAETITFRGKAVHGSTPYDGINALNAAALAILGIHSNRETFRDEDRIRIHPIITKGGDVVNSVPDEVQIDTYIRGATMEAIEKGTMAVQRSVNGAAQMIGTACEIEKVPGYLPLSESRELSEVLESAAERILGKQNIIYGKEITGSSDIGDLSYLLPVIQPSIGGFGGKMHSKDFLIKEEETAYIRSAQILACTAAMLLYNDAENARKVKQNHKQHKTKQEYLDYLNMQ